MTRARGIRASFPDLDPSRIPMAVTVKQEKVVYLLDPVDASRRSATMHFGDGLIRSLGMAKDHAVELPIFRPSCIRKAVSSCRSGNSSNTSAWS